MTPAEESTFRNRRPSARFDHSPEQVAELRDYILAREATLDRDLLPYGDPVGKDVLVFGCGFGNEVLWAVRHGARSVLAIDLSPAISATPFEEAMKELGMSFSDYEFRREDVHDTALTGDTFDLIVSNGVFEHVMDLKGVLGAFRSLLNPAGRVAIFADGMWYSSIGGHVGLGPWEHLWRNPRELKDEITDPRWRVYREQLNRMTAVDFMAAIQATGMVVLQMRLGRDPNLTRLPAILPKVQRQMTASPTDLSIVSIGCELCFVENLEPQAEEPKEA
jgi:SAM-dependent methyltransferase